MSSKIKVLQVIPKLGYGGAEAGCYDLAHYLAEKDCKSYRYYSYSRKKSCSNCCC